MFLSSDYWGVSVMIIDKIIKEKDDKLFTMQIDNFNDILDKILINCIDFVEICNLYKIILKLIMSKKWLLSQSYGVIIENNERSVLGLLINSVRYDRNWR